MVIGRWLRLGTDEALNTLEELRNILLKAPPKTPVPPRTKVTGSRIERMRALLNEGN